jgi:hypothetical protein
MKEFEIRKVENKTIQMLPKTPSTVKTCINYFTSGSSSTQQPTSEPIGVVDMVVADISLVLHQIPLECMAARQGLRRQCGEPLDATSERELLNTLLEGDLSEDCMYAIADDERHDLCTLFLVESLLLSINAICSMHTIIYALISR